MLMQKQNKYDHDLLKSMCNVDNNKRKLKCFQYNKQQTHNNLRQMPEWLIACHSQDFQPNMVQG
jgi:hypothetical protein